MTATLISPTTGPAQGSVAATLQRLDREPWWPVVAADLELFGRIVCAGHFMAWLDRNGIRIADCTERDLATYESTLGRFRPLAAYRRTSRELVRLARVWWASAGAQVTPQLSGFARS